MTDTVHADPRVYAQLSELVALQHLAKGFSLLPQQPRRSVLSGRHSSRLRGRGLHFEELRHYRPGDDVRALDWKVTHRTGKPHVRVFTEERERSVILLVDQRRSMFFGTREKMKSVVAAELAALIGWRTLAVGDRVGAVIFNDESIVEVKPQRSQQTLLRIFSKVIQFNHMLSADQKGGHNEAQLGLALSAVERVARHDNLVAMVSDLNGWNARAIKSVENIARHNDVIGSLIFDPMESQLPFTQASVVSDGVLQIQVKPEKLLRQQFREEFEGRVDYLKDELTKHRVPVLPINTVDPVLGQLRLFIGSGIAPAR